MVTIDNNPWFVAADVCKALTLKNPSVAAAQFGKRVDHFLANEDTREHIAALDEISNTRNSGELIQTKRGNNGGTFAHPKLAVFFARWLDKRFGVWCDAMIEDILTKKAEVVVTQPEKSAVVQATNAMPPQLFAAIQSLAQGMQWGWVGETREKPLGAVVLA